MELRQRSEEVSESPARGVVVMRLPATRGLTAAHEQVTSDSSSLLDLSGLSGGEVVECWNARVCRVPVCGAVVQVLSPCTVIRPKCDQVMGRVSPTAHPVSLIIERIEYARHPEASPDHRPWTARLTGNHLVRASSA